MIKSNYSRDYFIRYIQKEIFDEYELKVLDNITIASMRDDLYTPIMLCKENNIDIHDLFPIEVNGGGDIKLKFYQNGEVYKHDGFENKIVYLHRSYGSDSICQNK